MKAVLVLFVVLTGGLVQAESFECGYTEPFLTTKYDPASLELSIVDEVMMAARVISGVTLTTTGPDEFALVAEDGSVLQTMKLDFAGSDGMSEMVYPYSGVLNREEGPLTGGCVSDKYPYIPATN